MLVGGDGNDFLGATGGGCVLAGGAGNDTVFAVGNTNTMDGGDGDDFVGVSGNSNSLVGGAGDDYLGATGNTNDFDGGFGNDILEGASGHFGDRFIFHAGYGQDTIIGFAEHSGDGTDIIDIQGFGVTTFSALQAFMSQSGNDTVITLNGADILSDPRRAARSVAGVGLPARMTGKIGFTSEGERMEVSHGDRTRSDHHGVLE